MRRGTFVAGLILAAPAPFTGLSMILPDGAQGIPWRGAGYGGRGRGRELLALPVFPWIISASVAVDPFTPGLVVPWRTWPSAISAAAVFCGDAEQAAHGVAARTAYERSPSRSSG